MKRRSLTVLLCLLAIISLASVGFASWVISADDEEVATGNIQVEEVTDQRLDIKNIKFSFGQELNKDSWHFCFTGPQSATNTGWLTVNNYTSAASLETTLTFDVTLGGSATGIVVEGEKPNVKLTIDWDQATKELFKQAIDENLIAELPVLQSKLTFDAATGKATVSIKFEWGTAFGGKNPYDFYNSQKVNDGYYLEDGQIKGYRVTSSDGSVEYYDSLGEGKQKLDAQPTETFVSWGDDAETKLTKLFDIFKPIEEKSKTFKIVIKATHVAS